jgi:hypothetical protein
VVGGGKQVKSLAQFRRMRLEDVVEGLDVMGGAGGGGVGR